MKITTVSNLRGATLPGVALYCAALFALAPLSAHAQSATAAEPAATKPLTEAGPNLPRDVSITHKTADGIARAESNAVAVVGEVAEERIESRLAVVRNGRSSVTDPNVAQYDRAAKSGVKRVTPTMWQVFRF